MDEFITFNPRRFLDAIESAVSAAFDSKVNKTKEIEKKLYVFKEWLSESETADYLDVEKTTVQKLRKDGKLKGKSTGRKSYYHINDIKKYIDSIDD